MKNPTECVWSGCRNQGTWTVERLWNHELPLLPVCDEHAHPEHNELGVYLYHEAK